MQEPECSGKLLALQKRSWRSFVSVVQVFFEKNKNKKEKYCELVENLLKSYKQMSCRMSLKLRMIHSHLDFLNPIWETNPKSTVSASSKLYWNLRSATSVSIMSVLWVTPSVVWSAKPSLFTVKQQKTVFNKSPYRICSMLYCTSV